MSSEKNNEKVPKTSETSSKLEQQGEKLKTSQDDVAKDIKECATKLGTSLVLKSATTSQPYFRQNSYDQRQVRVCPICGRGLEASPEMKQAQNTEFSKRSEKLDEEEMLPNWKGIMRPPTKVSPENNIPCPSCTGNTRRCLKF